MPDAHAIFQPIANPAAVNAMLDDALRAFYAKRDTVNKRSTPLAFAAEDRRAVISERAAGMMARDSPDYIQSLRGRLFLKTTLTRAALSNPSLRVLKPAFRNLLVDTLSGVRAMILEARSEGIQYSVGTATYLYALMDAIALEPRGQDIMDKWAAANLVPVMLALAHIPAIQLWRHSAVDKADGHPSVEYETRGAQPASYAPARRDGRVKYEDSRNRVKHARHGYGKNTTVNMHIHFHAPYPVSPRNRASHVHPAQLPAARLQSTRDGPVRKREVSSREIQAYAHTGRSTSVVIPAKMPAEDLTAPAKLDAEYTRSSLAVLPMSHNLAEGDHIHGESVVPTPRVNYHGTAPLRLP